MNMQQLLKKLASFDTKKVSRLNESVNERGMSINVDEEVDTDTIGELYAKLQAGEIDYAEFRDQLDSLEHTDSSMRQGEMGTYDGDTHSGHQAWDQEKSEWDDYDLDQAEYEDDFDESQKDDDFPAAPEEEEPKVLEDDDDFPAAPEEEEPKVLEDDLTMESLRVLSGLNKTINECGIPTAMVGGSHTPASINITASSGPELTGMLKDIMSLAGVRPDADAHKTIDVLASPSQVDNTPSQGPDMAALIRAVDDTETDSDSMNDKPENEGMPEKTENRPWDSSPHEKERQDGVRKFGDQNSGDHRERQAGLPRAKPTTEDVAAKLFADYKDFVSEGKLDDLKDRQAEKKAAGDSWDTKDSKKDAARTVKGKSYGGSKAKDDDEELDEASIKLVMGMYQVWHNGKKVAAYNSKTDAQDHVRSLKEGVEELAEAKKPSAGMSKKEKSAVVKKAKAGKDIGKPGKGFEKVEKAAAKDGAKDPKAVAAAAMWKSRAKK